MGIAQLWSNLRQAGLVHELAGKDNDCLIAETVDGIAIAVDVSIWIVQSSTQPYLTEVFQNATSRALKVCFDRCQQWLRFGCIPVAVLEGESPAEKQAEIQKRFFARTGIQLEASQATGKRGHMLQTLNSQIAGLFEALGLPSVQAPGEAEATCAALQKAGLVQGCATKDSDTLALGATRIFHTITLAVNSKANALQFCKLADIRRWLGLESGGCTAILTLAFLVGGDYHAGGDHVGMKTAFACLRFLLSGRSDDEDLLVRLERALENLDALAFENIPTQCTGCKRCGHEGNRKGAIKQHSTRNRCACCPAPSLEDEAAGQFCRPIQAGADCQCPFHKQKDERDYLKMLQKLQHTPGFLEAAKRAKRAYQQQADSTEAAVAAWRQKNSLAAGDQLQWARRPDVSEVQAALSAGGFGLAWDLRTVRRKLVQLLREWDACHPSQGAEYAPARISKVAGSKTPGDDSRGWAYVVDWLKGGEPDEEVSDVEIDADGRILRRNNRGELVEAAFTQPDGEDLEEEDGGVLSQGLASQAAELARERKRRNATGGGKKYVRKSLLQTHWPQLVADFKDRASKQQEDAAKKEARRREKAAKAAFQASHKQSSIASFMRAKKSAPQAPKAAASKPRQPSTPALKGRRGRAPQTPSATVTQGPMDLFLARAGSQRGAQLASGAQNQIIVLEDSPPSAVGEASEPRSAKSDLLDLEPDPAAGARCFSRELTETSQQRPSSDSQRRRESNLQPAARPAGIGLRSGDGNGGSEVLGKAAARGGSSDRAAICAPSAQRDGGGGSRRVDIPEARATSLRDQPGDSQELLDGSFSSLANKSSGLEPKAAAEPSIGEEGSPGFGDGPDDSYQDLWEDDYFEDFGYAGESPRASVSTGRAGGLGDAAPEDAAESGHLQPSIPSLTAEPSGGGAPELTADESKAEGSKKNASCIVQTPEKRDRPLSPQPEEPTSSDLQERPVADVHSLESPMKKAKTPLKLEAVGSPSRSPLPGQAQVCGSGWTEPEAGTNPGRVRDATAQPETPMPTTGDSFTIVVSPDSELSATPTGFADGSRSGRRLDFGFGAPVNHSESRSQSSGQPGVKLEGVLATRLGTTELSTAAEGVPQEEELFVNLCSPECNNRNEL